MKVAACIFAFIIAAGATLLYVLYVHEQQLAEAALVKEPDIFFCGNAYMASEKPEEVKQGEYLFKANCAACHKLDSRSTGPALRNVNQRYTAVDIIKFIRNDFSGALQYNEETKYKCTSFPQLSDEDIKSILVYTH